MVGLESAGIRRYSQENCYICQLINITQLLSDLRSERAQIEYLILALEHLGLHGTKRRGRPPKWLAQAEANAPDLKPRRTVSPAARERMAEAQRQRWAKVRQAFAQTTSNLQ